MSDNGKPKALRFGPFELDLHSEELSRSGRKSRLQRQSFQVLVILLQRSGEVVTREELQKRLWPEGTFVDFERGLNNTVKRLREALSDSAESPKYIETLPRKGYRFIAPVIRVERTEQANVPAAVPSSPESDHDNLRNVSPALEEMAPVPAASSALEENRSQSSISRRAVLFGICSTAICAGGVWFARRYQTSTSENPMILEVSLPAGSAAADPGRLLGPPVISPDGASIVTALRTAKGSALFIRPLNSERLVQMQDTTGASYPFWSPDSQHVAFFADTKLKRIAAAGGVATVLCEAIQPRGGTWGIHGVILFGLNHKALFRVSESGGTPEAVTSLDKALVENSHRYPHFLPDGVRFLYVARTDDRDNRGIYLSSLDEPQKRRRVLVADGEFAIGTSNSGRNYLITEQAGKLIDQEFDVRSGELTSATHQLLDQGGSMSVSSNGVLAFRKNAALRNRLIWRDRTGTQVGTVGELDDYWAIQLSPDGQFVAEIRHDGVNGEFHLWAGPVSGRAFELVTTLNHVDQVAWSSDSKALVYTDYRLGQLIRRQISPRSTEQVLATGTTFRPNSIVQDSQYMSGEFDSDGAHASAAWFKTTETGLSSPHSLEAKGLLGIHPAFSPDGRWIAFVSGDTGISEVYVMDFPLGHIRKRVSSGGGKEARWKGDSSELFYLAPDGSVMVVQVSDSQKEIVSDPTLLFRSKLVIGHQGPIYDVSSDGQRFLLTEDESSEEGNNIKIVLNWPGLLER